MQPSTGSCERVRNRNISDTFLEKKTLKIYGADGGAALAPALLQIFYDHHGKEEENPMNMAQMGTVGELSFPAIPT